MAGMPGYVLEGGMTAPTLPQAMAGGGSSAYSNQRPHFGVIGVVLAAVAILYALDKFGFRFAVTAGRR